MEKQTKHSPEPCQGGSLERGPRQEPPSNAQLPGKGQESKRTQNSPQPKL